MEIPPNQNSAANNVRKIDLNCDVGESTGQHIIGNDQLLIPLVSSANIACGAHAGDEQHISNAVKIAVQHGVTIGAHPGYPDRANFGRQAMGLSAEQLAVTLRQQLKFLSAIVLRYGGEIKYVKPHGALYHRCNVDSVTARVVVEVAEEFGGALSMMGQVGTEFDRVCQMTGVRFIREAFADRRYLATGGLMPRSSPDSVITDPTTAALQAVAITLRKPITIESNHKIEVIGDSICIHGDNPEAGAVLQVTRKKLVEMGVVIESPIWY